MLLAFITDIHEDINNLKAVLRKIEKLKCDEIACLGDIVGYSAPFYKYHEERNGHECIQLVKSTCRFVVVGNHDMYAAQRLPRHCSFFQYPDNWYQLDYYERKQSGGNILWLHEENDLNPLLKEADIEFLQSLPEFNVIASRQFNIFISHYVYPNISGLKREFYTYHDEFNKHFSYIKLSNCQISFNGHAHNKGCFVVGRNRFKRYPANKQGIQLKQPVCIGIPPVTRQNKRSGFCTFNTETKQLNVYKT